MSPAIGRSYRTMLEVECARPRPPGRRLGSTAMAHARAARIAGTACGFAFALFAAAASAQLNLYCSSPNTAWCQGMAVGFEKAAGVKVAVVQKATGEMLAQVKAEAANPKGDVWWAGAADSYLQAAEEGLLETYASPNVKDLHPWAQRISTLSNHRVAGVYGGILALGYNTELVAKKKLPVPKCWKDLADPAWKGELMLGNPNSSGTAYLMLASLVQVFGEDEAFRYLKSVHPNVASYARSGIGPMTSVKRGEVALGSTVLHGVINDIVAGFPVLPVLPCEGVGYEVGSIAIVKGSRNLDNAKRFVDWALSPDAQKIGLDVKEYAIPTHRNVPLPPQVPNLSDVKVIDYDFAKYGASETRRRLLERWEKEINQAAR
jgi:iron(III) transport system substrate-binding protein